MHFPRKFARWALYLLVFVVCVPFLITVASADEVPRAALKYKSDLIRNARYVYGLDAPVAVFAAQIHQESRWNKDAKSAFAGGLAQFTPDTAAWISGAYPQSLGANQPYNPAWAIRALVTYDKQLYDQAKSDAPCDKMWKALWGYNGGMGWVLRDEKLAAKSGANIRIAKEVEPFNAGRAPAMFKENRDYPRAILLKWQPTYALWGGEITCL
jgi:soluble lytic murein transglycosylase-like protein